MTKAEVTIKTMALLARKLATRDLTDDMSLILVNVEIANLAALASIALDQLGRGEFREKPSQCLKTCFETEPDPSEWCPSCKEVDQAMEDARFESGRASGAV